MLHMFRPRKDLGHAKSGMVRSGMYPFLSANGFYSYRYISLGSSDAHPPGPFLRPRESLEVGYLSSISNQQVG